MSGRVVDVVGRGVYTRGTHVTPSMSPICNCHGCRFEKPQLEARAAAAERKLAALVMAVEREHKPVGHSLNVREALRDARDLLDEALAERAA